MSDTPHTDAKLIEVFSPATGKLIVTETVYASFARKLERENTELRARIAELQDNVWNSDDLVTDWQATATKERTRAEAAENRVAELETINALRTPGSCQCGDDDLCKFAQRAEVAEAQAQERNEIFRLLALPEGDFGALEKYAQAKRAAEALVEELREALRQCLAWGEACFSRVTENRSDFRFTALELAQSMLAKTPADMVDVLAEARKINAGHIALIEAQGAELARLRKENANLAEGIVKACAQLTEAENQALGGQDLVDALRARVAELQAEIKKGRSAWLGDDYAHLALAEAMEKYRNEANDRIAELERDRARLDWLDNKLDYELMITVFGKSVGLESDGGPRELRSAIDAAMKEGKS
jgi:predicted  nucleic acid-binding Zn-ribbon protein